MPRAEPTRPTPGGPQPPDWSDLEWAAWVSVVERGNSAIAAARDIGRSPTTVRNMIARWRKWWGDDIVPRPNADPARPRGGTRPIIAPTPSAIIGGGATQLVAASRVAQANLFGSTAQQAAQIISARLGQLAASPTDLALLSPRDLVDLARVVAMLDQRAAAILGEDTGRAGGTGVSVDLSGLESRDEADQATIDAARMIITEFHSRAAPVDEEIIEVAG
jgi:hypothetical protein